jgi:hypothetical protein
LAAALATPCNQLNNSHDSLLERMGLLDPRPLQFRGRGLSLSIAEDEEIFSFYLLKAGKVCTEIGAVGRGRNDEGMGQLKGPTKGPDRSK